MFHLLLFSTIRGLSFHLAYSFLCCAKAFKFNQVPLVFFCFYFHYSRMWVIEDLALIYAYVFSKSFIVSGLTFRFLIHFIFVYGVQKCSNFILLYVAGPVFLASFTEEAVFALLYILASFVKNKVPIGAWVYFWAFCVVPLVYISVFLPVPYCLDDYSFVV